MIDLDEYYNLYIKNKPNEDDVVAFLNDPAIMLKLDEAACEYLITKWLIDNGYEEIEED